MLFRFCCAVIAAAVIGRGKIAPIVENGHSSWKIVYGSGERDELAATDFQEIFEKSTGIRLPLQRSCTVRPSSSSSVFFVGAEFSDRQLADEQTWVTEKGGNIVLAGGGVAGSCYAVYDFCEKYFGYRLYGKETGDEVVKKVANLVWDGVDISTKPAFAGYRISHNIPKARNEAEARFFRRNRNNAGDKPLCKRVMGAQHGVHLWIPARAGQTWLDRQIGETWEPMFEKHPEYFTMHSDGRRIPDGQLCFTNRGLRDLFIRRFRAYASKMGPGIYTVGPYDSYNGRYCWCPECSKLVEKHKTNGAPLWDFIIELCDAVRDMKGVYVLSLAYKGPEQSEVAPVGMTFPENFICDAAFLNDRPPTMMPERKMPDGSVYNRVESLRRWRSITRHLAWWYYGGSSPMQTYRRMQLELRELRDFGVDSVGSDGTGGEMEFGDIGDYLYFQLLRNPDMDADAAAMDIFRHRYGAAAATVFAYLRELEEYALDGFKKPGFSVGCMDTYESLPVEGKDLVRWQGYFDRAVDAVKGDPLRLRNVEIARVGLDAWTVVFANRVREAVPSYPLDVPVVLARGLKACAVAEEIGMVRKDRNPARRVLESMKYYSALKSEALPPELSAYDPKDVRLYLPEDPLPCFAKDAPLRADPLAAAGVAMVGELRGNQGRDNGVDVKLYDAQTKEWLKVSPIPGSAFKDGQYVLVRCGTSRLPRRGMLVLGDRWGTSLDIRNLGRYYDPTYHHRQYEFWVSVRLDGRNLLCDRVYLVNMGMPD